MTLIKQPSTVLRNYGPHLTAYHLWTVWPLLFKNIVREPGTRESLEQTLLLTPSPWGFVERALSVTVNSVRIALDELCNDQPFLSHIRTVLPRCKGAFVQLSLLYVLGRIMKPQHILETGVASGVSSAFLLLSLERNRQGTLHSIDLPDYDQSWVNRMSGGSGRLPGRPFVDNSVPKGAESGWAVPDYLRSRWDLTLENTQSALPRVLAEVGHFDLALHDSDHSEEAILREGALIWTHLNAAGLLLIDDVDLSDAFDRLSTRVASPARTKCGRLGLMAKS